MKNRFKNKNIIFLIIFIILFITNFMTFWLYFKQENQLKVIDKYPYIDFSRNFQDQKDYITNLQPLRLELRELVKNYKGKVSIYIEYLKTGANISINQDTYIFPASLLKLPIAMTVMKKVELGEWSLDNELVLLDVDRDDKSGDKNDLLAKNKVGTRFTIRDLLIYSLRDSDNTAFRILYRNLSDNEIEKFIDATGLEKITDEEGKISAKEYSRILRSLYTASFLNRENSQLILTWLDQSDFNDFLSKPIDPNIRFSHKYGENLKQVVFSDSGIVYIPKRPYLISVMIEGDTTKPYTEDEKIKAEEFMHKVSLLTYNYFLSYNK